MAVSRERLIIYHEWLEEGSISILAMWYCIHDDLVRGFKGYLTVEDLWNQLDIQFSPDSFPSQNSKPKDDSSKRVNGQGQ